MSLRFPFVIVGAGPAGGRAALELVSRGHGASTALIGAEPYLPYERPPLSKDILQRTDEPVPPQIAGMDGLEATGVTVMLGQPAVTLDAKAKRVTLADNTVIGYDRLLLTTGTKLRRLNIPGGDLGGIHYLRNFKDSLALRADLLGGGPVVVIGGGFIGLEVAASARKRGCDVTVLEAAPGILGRSMPPLVAEAIARVHEREGVKIRCGLKPITFEGSNDERIAAVVLENGDRIPAAVVVIGIGVEPEVGLAEQAGLTTDNGILTDDCGRTSDPDIFAAGDAVHQVAPFLNGERLRQEAWQSALEQGVCAARGMLGEPSSYNKVPWLWSDQFDINIQSAGVARNVDAVVIRGDVTKPAFTAFQVSAGKLVGGITVNNGRDMAMLRRAVGSDKRIDLDALADPAQALRAVLL